MRTKTVVTGALLLFVAASVGYLVLKETGAEGTPSDPQAAAPQAPAGAPEARPEPHRIVAFYFHGQKRCNTCRAIQAQSREAVETGFPEALMSGLLEFREVNTGEAGNSHFVRDFELTGSSLVLAEFRDGRQVRFKNLQKVWDLHADKPAFLAYVQAEIRPWLEVP